MITFQNLILPWVKMMSKNVTLTAISSHIVVILVAGSDKANIFLVLFCTTLHSVSSMAVLECAC